MSRERPGLPSGIDAARWREIRAAFDALVELDATARAESLAALAESDPDLGRSVAELLAADSEIDQRLGHIDFAMGMAGASSEALEFPEDPLRLVGSTVSHFTVTAPLAVGGMGVLYQAEDIHLHRTIALKFPLPSHHFDRSTRERFLHEARSIGALDHPNICSIYEAGETADGHVFLAMPLYDGETLKARLARAGRLDIADAIRIAAQVAAGLAAAHERGIVHRDIKPANVMLLQDGSVKLLDFGIAKVREIDLTASSARLGTVSYMAPEQIEGQPVDARADLWALGVMLHEMLTGVRPFSGEYDVSIAHAILNAMPNRISAVRVVPPELDDLVCSLLRKDPVDRYVDAAEVGRVLASISGAGIQSKRAGFAARAQISRFIGSGLLRPTTMMLVAFALVVAIALGVALQRRDGVGGAPTLRRIVVLPLAEPGGETDGHYLAVGLGDGMSTELSRFSAVIAPTYATTTHYTGTTKPLSQIAKEMSADAVVTGSVRRTADRLFVTLDLYETRPDRHTWANSYDVPVTNVVDIQRDALEAILATLGIRLSASERAILARRPTSSARAYDLYLRGRELELRPGSDFPMPAENIRHALSLYAAAREIDPNFAMARARLAVMHIYSAMKYDATPARIEQARIEAEAALRIHPGLAEAHEALAAYWDVGRKDYAKSIEQLRLVLRGWPNSADQHLALAATYRKQGLWKESVTSIEQAQKLSPGSGTALMATPTYTRLRRYAESIRAWDRVIAEDSAEPAHRVARAYVFLRWHGSPDSLAAVMRTLPLSWDPNGMGTYARYEAARMARDNAGALAALNASKRDVSFDMYAYQPRALLRAQSYEALGQAALARSNYEAARSLLADSIAAHRDEINVDYSLSNPTVRMRIALALTFAGLGRKQDAVREARQAMEQLPLSSNHLAATATMAGAAQVFIRAGETTAALELLELLLGMPAGREVSVALLRNDPVYDPLRSDPRFEQMLQRFSPN